MVQSFKLKKEEVMLHIKCDIHSWMTTYVGVVTNPYFAVSNDGGNFEIANVPAGSYTILTWHERYGPLMQTVRVRGRRHDRPWISRTRETRNHRRNRDYFFRGVIVACFNSSSSTAFLSPGVPVLEMAVLAGLVDVASRLKQRVGILRLHDLQHLQRIVAQLVRVLVPQRPVLVDLGLDLLGR